MAQEKHRITEHRAGGLRLRLIGPPADLAPYISSSYRTEVSPDVLVEDYLPPEEGNLRVGSAEVYEAAIGDGPLVEVPNSIVSGPTSFGTRLRIRGGRFWGIGLTPAGWARMLGVPACDAANRFTDARKFPLPAPLAELLLHLEGDGDDIETCATRIHETFRGLLGERPDNEGAIQAVHLALLSQDATSVAPLAATAGMNPRTFERFCNRHFGFSARTLIKRQRFLRSLGKFMLDPSMKWISALDTHYWDQAHFIRDFKAVMGMTPSDYAAMPHPIVAAAVAVTHKGSGVAHQALYHPDAARDRDTGL